MGSIDQFIADGFLRLEDAFPRALADEARHLCHPFLVHAAQPHRGARPRFLAQPPLLPADTVSDASTELSPVQQATARALSTQGSAFRQ